MENYIVVGYVDVDGEIGFDFSFGFGDLLIIGGVDRFVSLG